MFITNYVEPDGEKFFHSLLLDKFLARGWFRMKTKMFTTNYIITTNAEFYDVYWMRVNLKKFTFSPTQRKLLKKAACFTTRIEELTLSPMLEEVYNQYREGVDFDISDTLFTSLYDNYFYTDAFNSKLISIHDGRELIAFGVLDEGLASAAGIINVFNPAYSKLSLGKVLIINKINYCLATNKDYFYPGYVTREPSKFSYKTSFCPAAIEIYDMDKNTWLPFTEWSKQDTST